jgi:hypothetical protein
MLKIQKNITLMISVFFFILFSFCSSATGKIPNEENKKEILNKIKTLKIPFIENKGQIKDKNIKYYAKTMGGTFFVTKDGKMMYCLPFLVNSKSEIHPNEVTKNALPMAGNPELKGWVLKESLVGTSIFDVKGEEKAKTKVNYFKGKEPSKWKSDIETYNLVSLGDVYKGIELKLKAYGNNVEKLFYVKPGADSESIKVKVEGAKSLKVNEKGELEVETGLGILKFTKPVAYQEENTKRKHVEVAYAVDGNEYNFKVRDYEKSKELIIDPLLASTFIGGRDSDYTYSISIDSGGNVYVAGYTGSIDFPATPGAYDTTFEHVFVSKFNSDLTTLLASTFLGGSWSDYAYSIDIDISGNVYVTGYTTSSDFPTTTGAYDEGYNGGYNDAFVSKFDSSLSSLLASTFIGGSYDDTGISIALDASGNVYVTGGAGPTYPTTIGAYDKGFNGFDYWYYDVFVSKFDSNLTTLLASTFLGGFYTDIAYSIAIDSVGNVYVTGDTASSDFPTTLDIYDNLYDGDQDAFVSKFDSNLTTLLASTFLGGIFEDSAYSIAIDSVGNVYVAGGTASSDFPTTPGSYDTSYNSDNNYNDTFVSKFDSNLITLLASTFLGGIFEDSASSIAIDAVGNVYIAGGTKSNDFPTTLDIYDNSWDGYYDVFVSKFDSDLSAEPPCPAEVTTDNPLKLKVLRNYRDNILTRSKSGIKYIKLYYQHAPEVTSLLIKDRELRKEAKELLNYLIPEIKLILKSKKIELLNSKLKNKIINFLNQVQGKANPELEAAIEKLMNDIENEKNKN